VTLRLHSPDDLDEGALIARALERDQAAVATITTRYNRRLFRVARSILRDDEDAEDALQSAYLRAFTNLQTFRREASLGTWLTRIVMNEALGLKRKRRSSATLERQPENAAGSTVIPFPGARDIDPERSMAQRQITALLEQAIDDLPESFRTVLVLRLLEGMSVEETAEALRITPETVKTRLHRARDRLRQAIERQVGPALLGAFPFDGWRCRRMTERVLEGLKD
jgi:RNA polymerase sigma-70 factor, ECF subfamily